MRFTGHRFSDPAGRNVALAAFLTALLLVLPAPPTGADEPHEAAPAPAPGETCRNDGAAGETPRDTVEASRPGPWRHDAKLAPPRMRLPGTRTAVPEDGLVPENFQTLRQLAAFVDHLRAA